MKLKKLEALLSASLVDILKGHTDVKKNKIVQHNYSFINCTHFHYEISTQRRSR